MLVFLENMIQFVFELAHRNIPRFGLTTGRRPRLQVFSPDLGATQGCYLYLNPFPSPQALEILIVGISELNGEVPLPNTRNSHFELCCSLCLHSYFRKGLKLLK